MSDMFKYMSMYMSGVLLSNPRHTRQALDNALKKDLAALPQNELDNAKFSLFFQDNLREKLTDSFTQTDNVELQKILVNTENIETNNSSNLLNDDFYDTFSSNKSDFESKFNLTLLNQSNGEARNQKTDFDLNASYAISRLKNADFASDYYDQKTVISSLSSMVDVSRDKNAILSLLENQSLNYQHHKIIASSLPAGEIKQQYQSVVNIMENSAPTSKLNDTQISRPRI